MNYLHWEKKRIVEYNWTLFTFIVIGLVCSIIVANIHIVAKYTLFDPISIISHVTKSIIVALLGFNCPFILKALKSLYKNSEDHPDFAK